MVSIESVHAEDGICSVKEEVSLVLMMLIFKQLLCCPYRITYVITSEEQHTILSEVEGV